MHNIDYCTFMRSLGLSTHPAQAARRMQKYPAHFKAKNNRIFISVEYASFVLEEFRLAQKQKELSSNIGQWWLTQEQNRKEANNG